MKPYVIGGGLVCLIPFICGILMPAPFLIWTGIILFIICLIIGALDVGAKKSDDKVIEVFKQQGGVKYAVITNKEVLDNGSVLVWFRVYFNNGTTGTFNCIQGTTMYEVMMHYC